MPASVEQRVWVVHLGRGLGSFLARGDQPVVVRAHTVREGGPIYTTVYPRSDSKTTTFRMFSPKDLEHVLPPKENIIYTLIKVTTIIRSWWWE